MIFSFSVHSTGIFADVLNFDSVETKGKMEDPSFPYCIQCHYASRRMFYSVEWTATVKGYEPSSNQKKKTVRLHCCFGVGFVLLVFVLVCCVTEGIFSDPLTPGPWLNIRVRGKIVSFMILSRWSKTCTRQGLASWFQVGSPKMVLQYKSRCIAPY